MYNVAGDEMDLLYAGSCETSIINVDSGHRLVVTFWAEHREIWEIQVGYNSYHLLPEYYIWQRGNWINVRELTTPILSYYNKPLDFSVIKRYTGKISIPSCFNWIEKMLLVGRR